MKGGHVQVMCRYCALSRWQLLLVVMAHCGSVVCPAFTPKVDHAGGGTLGTVTRPVVEVQCVALQRAVRCSHQEQIRCSGVLICRLSGWHVRAGCLSGAQPWHMTHAVDGSVTCPGS